MPFITLHLTDLHTQKLLYTMFPLNLQTL